MSSDTAASRARDGGDTTPRRAITTYVVTSYDSARRFLVERAARMPESFPFRRAVEMVVAKIDDLEVELEQYQELLQQADNKPDPTKMRRKLTLDARGVVVHAEIRNTKGVRATQYFFGLVLDDGESAKVADGYRHVRLSWLNRGGITVDARKNGTWKRLSGRDTPQWVNHSIDALFHHMFNLAAPAPAKKD